MNPDLGRYPLVEEFFRLQQQQASFFNRVLSDTHVQAVAAAADIVDNLIPGEGSECENIFLTWFLLYDKKIPRTRRGDAPLTEGAVVQRMCPPAVFDLARFEHPLNFDARVLLLQAQAVESLVRGVGSDAGDFNLLEAFSPRLLARLKELPVAEKPVMEPEKAEPIVIDIKVTPMPEPDFSQYPKAEEVYQQECGFLNEGEFAMGPADPGVFSVVVQAVDSCVEGGDMAREATLITAILYESHTRQRGGNLSLQRMQELYGGMYEAQPFLSQEPNPTLLEAKYAVKIGELSWEAGILETGFLPRGMKRTDLQERIGNRALAGDDQWLAKAAPRLHALYHQTYDDFVSAAQEYFKRNGMDPDGNRRPSSLDL